jgi:hypothetical protein
MASAPRLDTPTTSVDGDAGIAAILADVERYRGRRVATVLCGGNVTRVDAERWLVGMGQTDAASRQARS